MTFYALIACLLLQPPKPDTAPVQKPELTKEILERTQKDQAARKAIIAFMSKHHLAGRVGTDTPPEVKEEFEKLSKAVGDIDAENIQWLKEVVAKHGWP